MKVAYFCTTFPVLSETFLQREVLALSSRTDLSLKLYSLWGGENEWNRIPVHKIPKWKLLSLLWLLPCLIIKNPKGVQKVTQALFSSKPTSLLNFCENLLGVAIGFILAHPIKKENVDQLHATWASMPAATAYTLHHLLNIPFSFGAHAYDIFEHGGDWLLKQKIADATFIHTSTQNAANALQSKTPFKNKIKLIRRGLTDLPLFRKPLRNNKRLNLLSVGRLVEKKGYIYQLEIYRELKNRHIPFHTRILGDGPLRKSLENRINQYELGEHVTLLGAVSPKEVFEQYAWADFFIFTGVIASNGDRDGLPNVIPEAMASGVTVITSNVAGTLEAIKNRETGVCCPVESSGLWIEALQQLHKSPELNEKLRTQARDWVTKHFDAHKNAEKLTIYLRQSSDTGSTP